MNLYYCPVVNIPKKEYFLLVTHDAQFIYSGVCAYAWVMVYDPLYLSFPILWQQASYSLRAIFLPPDQSALTRSHYRAVMNIRCTAKRNNIMSDGCLNTLHKYNPEYIDYVCPTAGRRPVIIPSCSLSGNRIIPLKHSLRNTFWNKRTAIMEKKRE